MKKTISSTTFFTAFVALSDAHEFATDHYNMKTDGFVQIAAIQKQINAEQKAIFNLQASNICNQKFLLSKLGNLAVLISFTQSDSHNSEDADFPTYSF